MATETTTVTVKTAAGKDSGSATLAADVFGIQPARFEGVALVRNEHVGGEVRDAAAPIPLEQLHVPAPVVLPRSRLKRKPSPA